MKINKRLVAFCILLVAMVAATTALAARRYAWQVGYFDENGYMVGSITYPCGGGQTIEGVLEGTPIEIWSQPCYGYEPPIEH
ncbi:hypothetical protein [Pseudoxanthomonas sp. z9]|jgi:hypothetical protein|uniref:hypothetical protein n=1 Tax=Pseudoxanthomonas sp. z9 TaxID=2584942 RepID=UPI00114301D2|nr:hypothetical protein [Pseudoxanthomonas sp. z9]